MRNLLRCRRGVSAFVTLIAMAPLMGVVALGGEAGSWYVTKQHAQNAADAAAYSGALRLACTLAGSSCNDTAQTVAYRGKEFASQSAFCNAGDSTAYPGRQCAASLPTGVSQAVTINTLTTWNGNSGNFVQAIVSQQQPAYLAKILGLTTVNVGAQAIARVNALPNPPCALALTGPISFQGSANVNAPNCDMTSNDPASNALNFTGGGNSLGTPPVSLSAAGGCTGQAKYCNGALTYTPPIPNPFAALNGVTLPTLSNCSGGGLTAYSASTPCKNNNVNYSGQTNITLTGGVYFISGTLTLKGNGGIDGTGLIVLLPGASFSLKGNGAITTVGNGSVTSSQLPAALQPYASLLGDMALYDLSSGAINIGGNSDPSFGGTIYAPNAAVTVQGNPVLSLANCSELVAASIALNGNATFADSGCPAGTTPTVNAQYVQLVQ